jgi:hypothetical protein
MFKLYKVTRTLSTRIGGLPRAIACSLGMEPAVLVVYFAQDDPIQATEITTNELDRNNLLK